MIRGSLPPDFSPIRQGLPKACPPRLLRIVAWLWVGLLIAGSLQPARASLVTGHHRGIHWLAFGGGALLLFPLSNTRRKQILCAFAIFLLGISLEILQHFIYRNSLEWRDIADDGVAILLAFALYRLAGARKPGSEM
jgi:hypothetical protein